MCDFGVPLRLRAAERLRPQRRTCHSGTPAGVAFDAGIRGRIRDAPTPAIAGTLRGDCHKMVVCWSIAAFDGQGAIVLRARVAPNHPSSVFRILRISHFWLLPLEQGRAVRPALSRNFPSSPVKKLLSSRLSFKHAGNVKQSTDVLLVHRAFSRLHGVAISEYDLDLKQLEHDYR